MNWNKAKQRIESNITTNSRLPTMRGTFRPVEAVDGQRGPLVRIGESSRIRIPWTMLEKCFGALMSADGYDTKFFQEHFLKEYLDHDCHVHVVGQIFVEAGLAKMEGTSYFAVDSLVSEMSG